MVTAVVYVERCVVGLCVRLIGFLREVQGDFYKIDNLLVGFYCDFEAVFVKGLAYLLFNLVYSSGRFMENSKAVVSV